MAPNGYYQSQCRPGTTDTFEYNMQMDFLAMQWIISVYIPESASDGNVMEMQMYSHIEWNYDLELWLWNMIQFA